MSLKRIFAAGTATVLGLVFATSAAFAAVGTQNPNLTVQLTLDPAVVTAPGQVTGNGTITNNTNKTNRVVAQVVIISPSGVTSEYTQKYIIGPGQTVSETITYQVAASAEKGVYTITLSATDKKGASSATEHLTIQ